MEHLYEMVLPSSSQVVQAALAHDTAPTPTPTKLMKKNSGIL